MSISIVPMARALPLNSGEDTFIRSNSSVGMRFDVCVARSTACSSACEVLVTEDDAGCPEDWETVDATRACAEYTGCAIAQRYGVTSALNQ